MMPAPVVADGPPLGPSDPASMRRDNVWNPMWWLLVRYVSSIRARQHGWHCNAPVDAKPHPSNLRSMTRLILTKPSLVG